MIVRKATSADVRCVAEHVGSVTAEEWRVLGIDHTQAADAAVRMHDAAALSFTFDVRGEPAAVLLFLPDTPRSHLTLFLATDAFFGAAVAGVREGKKVMRAAAESLSTLICTYSYSPHPQRDKWFDLLGFKKTTGVDGTEYFLYT